MADNKLDIKAFLDKDEQKDLLRLLTAGSVDDGKSTLIRYIKLIICEACLRRINFSWILVTVN